VLALEYLHMHGFLYRDMKPENVLVGSDGHIRLTDFDLARINPAADAAVGVSAPVGGAAAVLGFAAGSTAADGVARADSRLAIVPAAGGRSFVGTVEYVAPEIILAQTQTAAVDWWIVGVLAYELLVGVTPFLGRDEQSTFENILYATPAWPKAPGREWRVSTPARAFVAALTHKDAEKRLGAANGAADVKVAAWFKGVRWSLVMNQQPPIVPASCLRSEVPDHAPGDAFRLYGTHFETPRDPAMLAEAAAAAPPDPFADFDHVSPGAAGAEAALVADALALDGGAGRPDEAVSGYS
jgi:serine/threonine protein kinase